MKIEKKKNEKLLIIDNKVNRSIKMIILDCDKSLKTNKI